MQIALVLVFTSTFFRNWANNHFGTQGSTGEFLWLFTAYTDGNSVNPYMTMVFWSVAGMAAFRAFGSTMYILLRLCGQ